MKKRKIILFIFAGGVLIIALFILIARHFFTLTPVYQKNKEYVERFDLELEGIITDIREDGSLRIACLKVEKSNYKDYRNEDDRFFIRVKDSLAVMIYSTKSAGKPRYHLYEIGSKVLINSHNNKQIIEVRNGVIIDSHLIATYPVRNYLKNSCVPD